MTADARDLRQLTDGVMVEYPSWTKRGSVGWSQATPVLLKGHLTRTGSELGKRINIQVHTAKGSSADVLPPRRIDIYCSPGGDQWRHAGVLVTDASAMPDGVNATLSVPVADDCDGDISLVFHATGPYLMLDELEVLPVTRTSKAPPGAIVPNLKGRDLLADSLRRLRTGMNADDGDQIAGFLNNRRVEENAAWVASPWGSLSVAALSSDQIATKLLEVGVPAGWPAQYVVGLLNSTSNERAYTLEVGGQTPVVMSRIAPVLAANGQVVFDPLVPMTGASISLPRKSVRYVLLRHAVVERSGSATVTVRSGEDWIQNLTVRISVLPDITDTRARPPDVVTWSYLSDSPIWQQKNREQLVRFEKDAGVNVFVIHPSAIPLPGQTAEWVRKDQLLRDQLHTYKGAGTVLLYVSWNAQISPEKWADETFRTEIESWLPRLVTVMKSEGYDYQDWAIYPVDEPTGEGFSLLAKVGAWIKARDPKVRLYANPGTVDLIDLLPGGAIYSVLDVIDLWQPLLGTPADRLGPILGRRGDHRWSIYEVGIPPAKTITPNCYRKVAWEAQQRGATGFGFWSFSDTGGSSAWDDFDGTRADWATVYEADGSVVSSRRWEAFRQGIQEYRALADCALSNTGVRQAESCKVLQKNIDTELRGLKCH